MTEPFESISCGSD